MPLSALHYLIKPWRLGSRAEVCKSGTKQVGIKPSRRSSQPRAKPNGEEEEVTQEKKENNKKNKHLRVQRSKLIEYNKNWGMFVLLCGGFRNGSDVDCLSDASLTVCWLSRLPAQSPYFYFYFQFRCAVQPVSTFSLWLLVPSPPLSRGTFNWFSRKPHRVAWGVVASLTAETAKRIEFQFPRQP